MHELTESGAALRVCGNTLLVRATGGVFALTPIKSGDPITHHWPDSTGLCAGAGHVRRALYGNATQTASTLKAATAISAGDEVVLCYNCATIKRTATINPAPVTARLSGYGTRTYAGGTSANPCTWELYVDHGFADTGPAVIRSKLIFGRSET